MKLFSLFKISRQPHVFNVLLMSTPFKILKTVIPFQTIFMIYLCKCLRVRNKGLCHKNMDIKDSSDSLFRETNNDVTIAPITARKELPLMFASSVLPRNPLFGMAPNSPIFCNRIQSLKSSNCFHLSFPLTPTRFASRWALGAAKLIII